MTLRTTLLADAERAISIITAYCLSAEHVNSGSTEEDVAGQAMRSLLDDIANDIADAQTEEQLATARLALFGTICVIAGIVDGLLDYMEVDKFKMIPFIAKENIERFTT